MSEVESQSGLDKNCPMSLVHTLKCCSKHILLLPDHSLVSYGQEKSIKIWNLFDGFCSQVLEGHTENVNSVILLSDQTRILSSSKDWRIKMWSIKNGICQKTFIGHSANVNCILQVNQEVIASGSDDKTIKLWSLKDGTCTHTFKDHTEWVISLCVLSEGNIASCSWDSTIKIYDFEKNLKSISNNSSHVIALNHNLFLSINVNNSMKIWDVKGYCLRTFKGHSSLIYCYIIINDDLIATGSFDKTIKIWNLSKNEPVNTFIGHTGTIFKILQINNEYIASCSEDKTIRIWDMSGLCVKVLKEHIGAIHDICLKEEYLISCGEDKSINIWNIREYSKPYTIGMNAFNTELKSKDGHSFKFHSYLLDFFGIKDIPLENKYFEKVYEFLYTFNIKSYDKEILSLIRDQCKIKEVELFCSCRLDQKEHDKLKIMNQFKSFMIEKFLKEEVSDVIFITKDDYVIKAHKGILIKVPYLKSLFEYSSNEIQIEFYYHSLKLVLSFIYEIDNIELPTDIEILIQSYEILDQFLLNDLKYKILNHMKKLVNEETAGNLLLFCKNYEVEGELYDACRKYDHTNLLLSFSKSIKFLHKKLDESQEEMDQMKKRIDQLESIIKSKFN